MSKPESSISSVQGLNFALNEAVQQWLAPLLDSYYVADQDTEKALATEQKKARELACVKACSSCCKTHKDIPVFPLELVGMTWHVP